MHVVFVVFGLVITLPCDSCLPCCNQSINLSVTCITAPLFVMKAASRRQGDESRNQLKATENQCRH